jgi:hypothetical protein
MDTISETHWLRWLLVFFAVAVGMAGAFMYGLRSGSSTVVYDYQFEIETPEGKRVELQYGIWPELAHVDFFNSVRASFIVEKAHFLEANLSAMQIIVYEEGAPVLTVPIKSKGKEGSWWETPSGLYRAEGKEETHFSSFGHVYMPWSIPFQGNFFIHGWPYYPDGTPVGEGYSGGCIRLEDEFAKQVYEHIKVGTPILVFEEVSERDFTYMLKSPEVEAKSYLVADLDTNFVLASFNTDTMSETTLLSTMMTAVVSSEYKNIEQKITVQQSMVEGNTFSRLTIGLSYSLYDLFFPLLLEDSEEVVRVIQESFGSTHFLNLVQTKAKALGMSHTQFSNDRKKVFSDTTTPSDVFLFLKYLHSNRPFILNMSANKTDTRTYGKPLFSNITPAHPFLEHESFLGGVANMQKTGLVTDTYQNEASVALVFASPEISSGHAKEDLISVFSLPFNGEMHTIGFIVLDSNDVKMDTKNLLSFVEGLYQ